MLTLASVPLQVCNHKFHSECLKGWGDTSCPVCRYCHETNAAQSHCQAWPSQHAPAQRTYLFLDCIQHPAPAGHLFA